MEGPTDKLQCRSAPSPFPLLPMYLAHYGLREPPFSITPDPRFVFLSERHRDALAHLLYGIGQGGGSGFVQLTGEVGTGKTTLSRLLLEQLPANARVALILNPLLSPIELLEAICEELRLDIAGSRNNVKALVDTLNVYLLRAHAEGLRIVLIIDEAQNLSAAALEQVRLLTNLETSTQKLLQIILLGQPELRAQLARPELRQLAQRITARYHLEPLDAEESEAYLHHRWAVAGGGAFPFTRAAAKRLHRFAGGVPRLLNVIAERALLAGYARGERVVGERLLAQAAREVLAPTARSVSWLWWSAAFVAVVALGIVVFVPGLHAPATRAVLRHPAHIRPSPPPSLTSHVVQHSVAPTTTSPSSSIPLLGPDDFARELTATDGGAADAWQRLFALWSVHPERIDPGSTSMCPVELPAGYFCASGKQTLSLIAQFDRPALLKLHAGGHSVTLLLAGLGTTRALLKLGNDSFLVNRSMVEEVLDGYAMIGRKPPGLILPVKQGDSGAALDWLRQRLLTSPAIPKAAKPIAGGFDQELAAAVRSVQRGFGLHGDGVVGPETMLALIAGDPVGPHLQKIGE
jgi:general secretion pathway protein A